MKAIDNQPTHTECQLPTSVQMVELDAGGQLTFSVK